jgi:fatty-acyl-CoA synthase
VPDSAHNANPNAAPNAAPNVSPNAAPNAALNAGPNTGPNTDTNADPSAYGYPLLIGQLLHTPLATAPDREIIYRDRCRHTYRAFRERLGRLAAALAQQGVGAGDTVAVMDWDSHRYLEAFFAIPMMGAVLQTVNVRLAPAQILYTLNHARADVLLVHADFVPLVAALRGQLATVRKFILIADGGGAGAAELPFAGEYEALLAAAPADFAFADFDEHARATTFYTTGTTGEPKGVHFSHRQIVLHTLAVAAGLAARPGRGRLHRDDVYMPITPMFHVHAWGLPYVATLLGLKQVYPGRYAPDTLLQYLAAERVSFSHCVPTILHTLLASPAAADMDLSGWKVIIGGAAFPRGLAAAALARGIDVFAGYGMSETGPVLTVADAPQGVADDAIEAQATARVRTGQPMPLVALRTVDGELNDVARDGHTPGEVVVRAPWLTPGYLHDPAASSALWAGGWLHTGDIGTLDTDGTLQITDRLKDVIKTGGEWISSLELESLLSQHPAVSEVAVIGMKDEQWGERPLALVVLKDGCPATADELRALVRSAAEAGRISRFAVPERVDFVTALPRTSVGKLDKKAMRGQQS